METKNMQGFGRKVWLEVLRRQIAKAASFAPRSEDTIPLGMPEVDACLKGGLLSSALHEIAAADHRSIPAALGFLLALAGRHGKARVLWPFMKTTPAFGRPYAPGLRFFGLDPGRIVFVRCSTSRECLWAMEEGLRLGGIATVIGTRPKTMDLTASRRLQLASEQANTPVFLLRNYNDHAPSAAITRWRVSPAPSARDEFGFYKNARFRVALDYARAGKTGEWVMEWDHDALSLRLSSALGDRAAGENRAA
jgi:protein ImuA